MSNDKLAKVEKAVSLLTRIFEDSWSYDEKAKTQEMLEGKTYYYSNDSMAFHKSRLVYSKVKNDGLLLVTCESYENYDKSRLFRFVVFDCFGIVVFRANEQDNTGYKTKAQAQKHFEQWHASFDCLAYYEQKLIGQLEQTKSLVKNLQDVLGG